LGNNNYYVHTLRSFVRAKKKPGRQYSPAISIK